MSEYTPEPVDDSEYTASLDTGVDDQIDLDETLGLDDEADRAYDTGYSPPERPLGLNRFGTTLAEQERGESLDQRLAEEEPDPNLSYDPGPDDELISGEVGRERAGRLVDPDQGFGEDREKDLVGTDVGIDAGAASAEEAAVHVIDEDDDVELGAEDLPAEAFEDEGSSRG